MSLWFSVTLAALAVAVSAAAVLYDYAVSRSRPFTAVRLPLTTTLRVTALIGFLVLIIVAQFLLSLGGHTGSAPACASGPFSIPDAPR